MRRFVQFMLFLLFLITVSYAESKTISKQTYYEYRLKLISKGWVPFKSSRHVKGRILGNDTGDAGIMRSSGYPEVERCTGVEQNFCSFIFKKKNICRIITTTGEYSSDLKWPIVVSFEEKNCRLIQ